MVKYIFDEEKTQSGAVGYRNLPDEKDYIPAAMKAISSIWGQELDGKRKAEHFIISLSKKESAMLGVDGLHHLSEQYCDNFTDEYQIAFAVHVNKQDQLHTHFVINPVSIRTGNRMHKSAKFLHLQRQLVQKLYDEEVAN